MPGVRSAEAIARRNARRYERLKAQRRANGAKPRLVIAEADRVAHRREHDRAYRRVKHAAMSEADRKARRERDRAYRRAKHAAMSKADRKVLSERDLAKRRAKRAAIPFVGCDGEATTHKGEASYCLFRMGDRVLYRGGRRLETPELLSFILDAPPRDQAILVGFAFSYDVSNILLDVPMRRDPKRPDVMSRMERILCEKISDEFRDPWTWLSFDSWPEFGVTYLPGVSFQVCLAQKKKVRTESGKVFTKRVSVPGSIRTIWDTFGFFQTSFLGALNAWNIGAKHWPAIKKNKAKRSGFARITKSIARYNKIECELLAEMMGTLRETTIAAGIHLTKWYGAGCIADHMLREHGAGRRRDLEGRHPKGLLAAAAAAYYGGRSEITRLGHIDSKVTCCDINSAYPAALQEAPCHVHGKWKRVDAASLQKLIRNPKSLFVAAVQFHHPKSSFLCGLPLRQESGAIMWPRDGCGTYWSVEIRSAQKLGCQPVIEAPGWLYEKRCDCEGYPWLKSLYEARKALGKATRGIPLKLGLNATYGKLAQRVGYAPWGNVIDASLCTATTRAALNQAIAKAGAERVIMLATDAVYLIGGRPPKDLARGQALGQWEISHHKNLFIAQPGLYWPPKSRRWRVKSRGISAKFFEPMVPAFHRAWASFMRGSKDQTIWHFRHGGLAPLVPVPVTTFIGLRLAMHRRAYDDACRWIETKRLIDLDWRNKRSGVVEIAGRSLILPPKAGDPALRSITYEPRENLNLEAHRATYESDLEDEGQPDYVDLGPPFK